LIVFRVKGLVTNSLCSQAGAGQTAKHAAQRVGGSVFLSEIFGRLGPNMFFSKAAPGSEAVFHQPLAQVAKVLMAGGLALSLAGCLGYDGEIIHGYQPDARALEQVRPGAAAEQVLTLLGTPSTTSTVGGEAWYYISQQTTRSVSFFNPTVVDQHVYAVYFDKNKKVTRIANFGVQDGKVIDFVSRTTPTGGAEASLLRGLFSNLMRFGGGIN